MKKQAQLGKESRFHSKQRAPQQCSSAKNNLRTAPSLKTNACNPTGGPSPSMAVQKLAPHSRKRPVQNISNTDSSKTMTEPIVKRQKRTTSKSPVQHPNKDKDVTQNTSEHNVPEDGTSDEDGGSTDSDDERQKEIFWQAFSGRYAELMAEQSSTSPADSLRQRSDAASMVGATVGAPENHKTSEKPRGTSAATKGGATSPVEIDSG